jgi:hypothetical protein
MDSYITRQTAMFTQQLDGSIEMKPLKEVVVVVVYLTTLFQQLRLYSVDFYSILIRLPSSSEAGETRVRKRLNFADEYLSCS